MFYTGLCSVTFRALKPEEIVKAAASAGLQSIEWGGDIHVPPGKSAHADEVKRMTESAGLRVSSYGSYYRVGCEGGHDAESVVETAAALGAPVIRVWAGDAGSADTDESRLQAIARDARRIAAIGESAGIGIAFEYHNGTYADTPESALRLLAAIDRPNVRCYWQTSTAPESAERELHAIRLLAPHLCHIHVFHWSGGEQRPLREGKQMWSDYAGELRKLNRDITLLLEFTAGGSTEQMAADAAVLREVAADG